MDLKQRSGHYRIMYYVVSRFRSCAVTGASGVAGGAEDTGQLIVF